MLLIILLPWQHRPLPVTVTMAQNWIMIISELRRYQGVCYKSDITVISGEASGRYWRLSSFILSSFSSIKTFSANICPVLFNFIGILNLKRSSQQEEITDGMLSGLDLGDRQVLEQRFAGCDPPCLLDSSDGRWERRGRVNTDQAGGRGGGGDHLINWQGWNLSQLQFFFLLIENENERKKGFFYFASNGPFQ